MPNTEKTLEQKIGLSTAEMLPYVTQAINGADDGELYLEESLLESVVLDDGEIQSTAYASSMGFGLRRVVDEFQAYVYGNNITKDALKKAATELYNVAPGNKTLAMSPAASTHSLYTAQSPLDPQFDLPKRIAFTQKIDQYIRSKDNRVRQVEVILSAKMSDILILRPNGYTAKDRRPLVILFVFITMDDGKRKETAMANYSRREGYHTIFEDWQTIADDALKQADTLMQAIPCPAGEMPVILAGKNSGVIFHEAIGHGLEGDAIRTGSCFSGLLGEQVAAKGVTIVDDGTVHSSRGSLNIDDEGTPTRSTTLIEDGKLVAYMNDRLNGRLLHTDSTGNGRRQSYRHRPLVRMTNTYMLGGNTPVADIIPQTKERALYAVDYSGGQVDTTAGKFVFQAREAYLVENGKIIAPVKGATLIGSCLEALKNIDLIGDDAQLNRAGGTCGKMGQGVPVSHGMPTIRLTAGITVGGTESN